MTTVEDINTDVLILGAGPAGCAAATLPGFREFFDRSSGGRHSALLASVWVCGDGSVPKRT